MQLERENRMICSNQAVVTARVLKAFMDAKSRLRKQAMRTKIITGAVGFYQQRSRDFLAFVGCCVAIFFLSTAYVSGSSLLPVPDHKLNPVTTYPEYSIRYAAFAPGKQKMVMLFFDYKYSGCSYMALYDFVDQTMTILSPPENQFKKMVFHTPNFSPDGSKIAITVSYFEEGENKSYARTIALLDTKTLHIKELTPLKRGVERHSPSFSHDGQKLIYIKATGRVTLRNRSLQRDYTKYDRRVAAELVIKNKKEKELFGAGRHDLPYYRYGEPGYLLGGGSLDYVRKIPKDALVPKSNPPLKTMIYRIDAEDVLGNIGSYPSFSFDQRIFINTTDAGGGDGIYIGHAERSFYKNPDPELPHISKNKMRMIAHVNYLHDLSLSPDGSTALIVSKASYDVPRTSLLVLDIASGEVREFDITTEVKKATMVEATVENSKGVRYE